MAEELGRITRPEAEQFKKGRRLFMVPLLFAPPSPPGTLQEIIDRYWVEALQQVNSLESRIGKINRVYHEMVAENGESGLKAVESMSPGSCQFARNALERGAEFTGVEDSSLLGEFMDWGRCLAVGLYSSTVLEKVLNFYQEVQAKRNQALASNIDKSLGSDEIGLLIAGENHRIQFPSDIEVFYVAPPALDEFKRWLREQEYSGSGSQAKPAENKAGKEAEKKEKAAQKGAEKSKKAPASKTQKRSRKKGEGK